MEVRMSLLSMWFPILVVVVFMTFSISLFSVYLYVNWPPRTPKQLKPAPVPVRPISPANQTPVARLGIEA
jgi:hypothetical protein